MYKIFLTLIASVLLSSSLYSEEISSVQTVPGNVIIKLKNNITIPSSVNDEINSSANNNSFGVGNIDELLEEFQIKDIRQKFPHHSSPEFQAQLNKENRNEINTLENVYLIKFDNDIPVRVLIQRLKRLPEVEYAEPVYIHQTTAKEIKLQDMPVPNDEYYNELHHLELISAPQAWEIAKGEDGAEVIVGIGDSGIEWHHPDLIDNLWENLGEDANGNGTVLQYNEETQQWEFDSGDINGIDDDLNGYVDDFSGWNFVSHMDDTPENDIDASELNYHGTHVAGIAAGVTNNGTGIASVSWNVKFMGTKHSNNEGGAGIPIYYGYDGIVYLAENGADIINLSWSGGRYSHYNQDVISYANSIGAIIVASAGNNNNSLIQYPSSYSGVISVASVASNDERAYYSSFGSTVDVSAPGGDVTVDGGILSTIPGNDYGRLQGTSMAAPVVTGLLALVKSHFPDMSNDEVVAQVIGTTDNIDNENPNYENMLGSGRINAYSALTQEPTYQEGLILNALNYDVYEYDEESGEFLWNDVIQDDSEGKLEIVISNSNFFYGQENVEISISTDYDGLHIDGTYVASFGKDDYIILETEYFADNTIETGFANITLTFSDPDNDILYGETFELEVFVNTGGILVWEPTAYGQDMSGNFIRDYYVDRGHNVYYSNELLPTFAGFDAIFVSLGSTMAPNYYSYISKQYGVLPNLINYIFSSGGDAKIFLESSDFLTNYNRNFTQGPIEGMFILFGLMEASHIPEESLDLSNIYGVQDGLFNDLYFNTSSQENTYEMNMLTPHPFFASSLLEVEDFGTVATIGYNPMGSKIVTTSAVISQLDDADCSSSRRNLMRRLSTFFELYDPVDIVVGDMEVCQGAPVSIGIDDDGCDLDAPFVNIVHGGSGYFSVEWTPKIGLDNGYTGNPTLMNPVIDRNYVVTVTDLLLEESYSKNIQITVNKGARVRVPLFVMHPMATPINLNERIISITGGATPYEEYIWTDQNGYMVDPENEIPAPGLQRYYLSVIDANGCPSKTVRMIVYVSAFKQFSEDDIVAGDNGSLLITSYPNPANDVINLISVFESNSNATVSIVDINGKEVYSQNKFSVSEINESININNLSSGTYFIIVNSDEDKVMKKFIKE